MESMEHESMVTMYHLDKGRVMMTHYCSAQNQPRMQARCRMTEDLYLRFSRCYQPRQPSDGTCARWC